MRLVRDNVSIASSDEELFISDIPSEEEFITYLNESALPKKVCNLELTYIINTNFIRLIF
jgi:hypothetical protein